MGNRTYYGLQTGAAFMSGMAESYNRNLLLQADIKRYESQMAYQRRQEAFAREQFEFEKEYKTKYLQTFPRSGTKLQLKQIGEAKAPYTFDPTTGKLAQISGIGKHVIPKTIRDLSIELNRWQTIQNKTREVGVLGQFGEIHDQETYDLAQGKINELGRKIEELKARPQSQEGFLKTIQDIEDENIPGRQIITYNRGTRQKYINGIAQVSQDDISEYITGLTSEDQKTAIDIWATADEEDKKHIIDALNRGVSMQDIIDWMKINVR